MSRYIDADALREKWLCLQGHDFSPSSFVYSIDNAPTVDAVSVPCYVGEEIWYVPEWNKKPFKAVCHCISIDKGGVRVHLYDMDGDNATYPARLVFKTKEDAEKYILKGEEK